MIDKLLRKFGYVKREEEMDRIIKLLECMRCDCGTGEDTDWGSLLVDSELDHVQVGDFLTYSGLDFELGVTAIDEAFIHVKDEAGFDAIIDRVDGRICGTYYHTNRAGWERCACSN